MANRQRVTKLGQILIYLIPLLLVIGITTLSYSGYIEFGILECVAKMMQFFNSDTIYTADYLYNNYEHLLGIVFYVTLGLIFISVILLIWDYFRKKDPSPKGNPEDFKGLMPEQIVAYFEGLKIINRGKTNVEETKVETTNAIAEESIDDTHDDQNTG